MYRLTNTCLIIITVLLTSSRAPRPTPARLRPSAAHERGMARGEPLVPALDDGKIRSEPARTIEDTIDS